MTDGPRDLFCASTVHRSLHVVRDILQSLRTHYGADAVLSAFSAYIDRLNIEDVMTLTATEEAQLSYIWLDMLAAEHSGKEPTDDEKQAHLDSFVTERRSRRAP